VIIRPNKSTEVGSIDRPKPAVLKDLVGFIKKEMGHVDLVLQVVLVGGFSVVSDLPEV
jgi:hypothetical protein